MTKAICILSGGMDSTTLLYKLVNEGKEVKAISFHYGQKHKRELEMAKATCTKLGIEHQIVELAFLRELISNSSLTGDIAMPQGHYGEDTMRKTVVPNRNMIMASIAIGWAVNIDFDEVATGIHEGDRAQYPDCRPTYLYMLQAIAQVANFKAIRVYAPFLYADKGDIAIEGLKLSVDFKLTNTCYEGKDKPCMRCGSCVERTSAFKKAGVRDMLYSEEEWIEAVRIHDEYQEEFDSKHEKTANS